MLTRFGRETGYPWGQVTADLQFFDAGGTQIGTSTLVLSVARP